MFTAKNISVKPVRNNAIGTDIYNESSSLDILAEVKDERSISRIAYDAMLEMLDITNESTKSFFKSMVTEEATAIITEAEAKSAGFITNITSFIEKAKKVIMDCLQSLIDRIAKKIRPLVDAFKKGIHRKSGSPKNDPSSDDNNAENNRKKIPTAKPTISKDNYDRAIALFNSDKAVLNLPDLLSLLGVTNEEIDAVAETVPMKIYKKKYFTAPADNYVTRISSCVNGKNMLTLIEGLNIDIKTKSTARILFGGDMPKGKDLVTLVRNNEIDIKDNTSSENEATTSRERMAKLIAAKLCDDALSASDCDKIADDASNQLNAASNALSYSDSEHSILENGTVAEIVHVLDDKRLDTCVKGLTNIKSAIKSDNVATHVKNLFKEIELANKDHSGAFNANNITKEESLYFTLIQRLYGAYMDGVVASCTECIRACNDGIIKGGQFTNKLLAVCKSRIDSFEKEMGA